MICVLHPLITDNSTRCNVRQQGWTVQRQVVFVDFDRLGSIALWIIDPKSARVSVSVRVGLRLGLALG
jgi:hypothetical protein